MAWLHWHDIPKSQAFFLFRLGMAISIGIGTLLCVHRIPWWGVTLPIALFGGFLTGVLVRWAYADRAEDRDAEARSLLTRRDIPALDSWLNMLGASASFSWFWALVFSHDFSWTFYFCLFWLLNKAKASPRYPKPPEKRIFVPAHSTG